MSRPGPVRPRFVAVPRTAAGRTTTVLAALGFSVSVYLTVEHFTAASSFACPENATFNCVAVTTSQWSSILGVPVALLGLLFFAAVLVLCLLPGRRPADLRVVAAAVGTVMVLWLVYVELFLVDAICLWCTAVHVLTVALLATATWWRESVRVDSPAGRA